MQMRPTCPRCRRPTRVCYCAALKAVDSRTRVVFVQHPLEARVAISTCRMAHLSLPNSELHVGVGAEGDARLEAVCREEGTWVLFPSESSTPVEELAAAPKHLIVVDGTWDNARKVVTRSALLAGLPRIGFRPEQPGNYRIRKEPKAHCLSTIEAVAHVLGRLENDLPRFTAMLSAFDAMVERQLDFIEAHAGQSRYQVRRVRNTGRRRAADVLREGLDRLVLVHGEANAWPPETGVPGPGELIQLVALRPATGERFEALLAPRRPLGQNVPLHLDLPAARLLAGEQAPEALARFRAFLGEGLPCAWRRFAVDLLAAEGQSLPGWLDLRRAYADTLGNKPGTVEAAAAALGAALPDGQGRAARRIEAMRAVVRALAEGRVQSLQPRRRRRDAGNLGAAPAAT